MRGVGESCAPLIWGQAGKVIRSELVWGSLQLNSVEESPQASVGAEVMVSHQVWGGGTLSLELRRDQTQLTPPTHTLWLQPSGDTA